MNPTKNDLKPKQEFPGSAGKGKLPAQECIRMGGKHHASKN